MESKPAKKTTQSIRQSKGKQRLACVTAYDTLMALQADRAGVDIILVGDSVGTTLLGFDTTIPVTLDMIAHHTAAVARARPTALVVADLPFPEGRRSFDRLLDGCARLMQTAGAEAVKIEGGGNLAPHIARLGQAGVPVLGHIGLLPQRYFAMGGYRRFGRAEPEREKILADAMALQEAGVFAIIGEMIEQGLAAELTATLDIPFIGIGCGSSCDGQILVSTDLLGMHPGKPPAFVKIYEEIGNRMHQAFAAYTAEVRDGRFPT